DSLRMAALARVAPFDLDGMLESDLEVWRTERERPVAFARTVADSLPGFGIAAAVLGVVVTMGSMDRSPAEMGAKIGAAMVGTFLGVLLSYGFAGPVAERISGSVDADSRFCRLSGLAWSDLSRECRQA
ncbi:MAG: MotA/TolQ/ExbB proton channel family protein, partial [Phycisphaerae bacterium]